MTAAWISSISLWEEQKFTLKNLHFWDQLKASFSSNICPDCISCHLEFQNVLGEDPPTPHQCRGGIPPPSNSTLCVMSSLHLLPKILHLLKNFLRTLLSKSRFGFNYQGQNIAFLLLLTAGLLKITILISQQKVVRQLTLHMKYLEFQYSAWLISENFEELRPNVGGLELLGPVKFNLWLRLLKSRLWLNC